MKRCNCLNTTPSVVVDPPIVCPNCFIIPSLYVKAQDSIGLCGETGQVDLLEHAKVTVCSTSKDASGNPIICPITWTVLDYGKGFSTKPTITNGILSFTSANNIAPLELTFIKVKAQCTCSIHSTFVNIQLSFKDKCSNVKCEEGFHCDPCTGTCILNTADFSGEKKSISSTALSGITFKK